MREAMNPFFKPIFNEGKEAGYKEGFAIGFAEGLAEARAKAEIGVLRRAVVRVLRRRFGEKAERAVGRVEALKATFPALESLVKEAAVAPTVAAFLRKMPSRAK